MDIPTPAELVGTIDRFLARHDMAETRFGRDCTGEADLVPTLRAGRNVSHKTLLRIAAFIAERDAERGFAAAEPNPAIEWPVPSADNGSGIIRRDGQSPGLGDDNSIGSPGGERLPFSSDAAGHPPPDPPSTGAPAPASPSPPTLPISSATPAPPPPPAASPACSTDGEADPSSGSGRRAA